jgi:hypothetical protein
MPGINSLVDEAGGGTPAASGGISTEYKELADELWALLSRFNLARRLKIVLPKICTLSGRSRDGMLLDVDLFDDFLDRVMFSMACSQEGRSPDARDRKDEEPEDVVWWL